MTDIPPIVELFEEQLLQGSVYTRLNGAMVSKNQAQQCIEQAYKLGMLKMYDMLKRGDDISEMFAKRNPEEQFVKIP